jgi:glutamate--cysteine ligase
LDLTFFGMGLRPLAALAEIPTMPKSRYEIMKRVMPTLGRRSLEMMFCSATVQTNLDFRSEADLARKYRASACVSPIVAALFANSPYQNGRRTGRMTERYAIWDETDTGRSGRFAWMVDEALTYRSHADWALGLRRLFVHRDGLYRDAGDQSFKELYDAAKVNEDDWQDHLGGIFPEVRLKSFIELRSADAGCGEIVVALNALWTGLLYDEQSLSDVLSLCAGWRSPEWERMAQAASLNGLAAQTDFGPMTELAAELIRLADDGLKRRAKASLNEKDERAHLAPLQTLVHMGASQAELLVKRFGDDAEAARSFAAADLWEFPW